ncbi:hypothetical protein [Maridesulfovibrio sp.]|uniref:hypothetical protein n=1 Tax=Maridesulfovibrio sp. TaxID=2795000 RepID=UPI0039EEDFEB
MDNATIAGIAQAGVNQMNSLWDWKLIVAVIGAISVMVSSIGTVVAVWYNWKKTKLELRSAINQKWANDLIDVFAEFDAKNREMINRGLGVKSLINWAALKGQSASSYVEKHENNAPMAVYEHSLLLNKLRLLFDPDSIEYQDIIKALIGYDECWRKRINGDNSNAVRDAFDAYTNELYRLIGQIVHREIRIK